MIMQELGRALAASSVWAVEGGQDQVQDEELDEPDEEPATTPRPSMGTENVVVERNLQELTLSSLSPDPVAWKQYHTLELIEGEAKAGFRRRG